MDRRFSGALAREIDNAAALLPRDRPCVSLNALFFLFFPHFMKPACLIATGISKVDFILFLRIAEFNSIVKDREIVHLLHNEYRRFGLIWLKQ